MKQLPPETVETIKQMRHEGATWAEIKETFQISYHSARCAIDPVYRNQRQEAEQRRKKYVPGEFHTRGGVPVVPAERVEACRTWKDREDTRDLTGVLLGDPYPGRSALDQRQD